MRNTYVIWTGSEPPRPWTPPDTDFTYRRECVYWGGAFSVADQLLRRGGRTFYLTWDLCTLPSYGPDVVAVVLGDEWFNYPKYLDRVGMIFKTYGVEPTWSAALPGLPGLPSVLATAEVIRTLLRDSPKRLDHYARRLSATAIPDGPKRRTPVHAVPLGYYNQLDLPMVPFASRKIDVNFSGSVYGSTRGIRKVVHGPKEITRSWMLARLHRLEGRRPDLRLDFRVTGGFPAQPTRDEALRYSETLMNTRICLAPRGTSVETHRVFEALRAGCVVVTNPLPSRWYYDTAPVIQLRDWRKLNRLLETLLADEQRMESLHHKALRWCREVASEAVVGRFLAHVLNTQDAAC